MSHAAVNSKVGAIAAYTKALNNAQAITDPVARAAAISKATASLQAASNKDVTPSVVGAVNSLVSGKNP